MTLRELIAGLDEDLLDVQVIVKVPGASGTYQQTVGVVNVTKDLHEVHDGENVFLDIKHSRIIIDTTPVPGA